MERQLRRALGAPLFLCGLPAAQASVIISEVFYDAAGADANQVFVELFGTAGTGLDGWSLVGINGSTGRGYLTVNLAGVIPADGVFVVADGTAGATEVSNADFITSANFQNGADSIQLFQGATLMDAVGYGDFASAVFAGEGAAAMDVAAGDSLARWRLIDTDNNGADFVAGAPTPGVVPVSAVPVPAALWLFGPGLCALVGVGRRRRI